MKYLITLVLLIAVAINGLTSYHLFRSEDYDLSHLLIIASFGCMVGSIYALTVRSKKNA